MKGRITCPKCAKQFKAEAEKGMKKLSVNCPHCNNKFNVRITYPESDECIDVASDVEECTWEEHGEPRKTILSSIKPRTDKPMFVAFLLTIVFIIAIISAFSTATFIETPTSVLSATGIRGSLQISVLDTNNAPIENIYVNMNDKNDNIQFSTDQNGNVAINDINLGKNQVWISYNSSDNKASLQLIEVFVYPFIQSNYEFEVNNVGSVPMVETSNTDMTWCSIIIIILSIICLIGAICAWKRKHFDIAIVGSIIGIFTIGIFFVGAILSIASLIILFYSKEEFENGKKGKRF
jgi:hypothetical protein